MKYFLSLILAVLLSACNNEWDEHYSSTDIDSDWGSLPEASITLYDILKENEEEYSYILSLFDLEISEDERASSWLNRYIDKYQKYTIILFTDKQFDEKLNSISNGLLEKINENNTLKTALIKATILRNMLIGNHEIVVGEEYQTFDKKVITINSEFGNSISLKNSTVYRINSSIELFPIDFFTVKVETESWSDYVMGGGSSRTTVMLPKAYGGNGVATCFKDNGAHLFLRIGGVVDDKSYMLIDGVSYKIKVLVGLYKSMKAAFWTDGESGDNADDQKLYMENSLYFDAENDFCNANLNAGMALLEFEAPLYNRENNKVKFHIDFRNRKAPDVDGEVPTAEQRGLIIDYIEFEPMFN